MKIDNFELKDFTLLNIFQKEMILSWRNDNRIKRWMYTNDEILLENHLSFIESLKNNKQKRYFLVSSYDKDIGIVNFTDICDDTLEMGLYTNPNLKGFGKDLMNIIKKYSFEVLKVKKIFAEVFVDNEKAFTLYKEFGFEVIDKKLVNEKEVYCMELIYENR